MISVKITILILLTATCLISCSYYRGVTGIPEESPAYFIKGVRIDGLHCVGRVVTSVDRHEQFIVSMRDDRVLLIQRIDTSLNVTDLMSVTAPTSINTFQAISLPGDRMAILGVSQDLWDEEKSMLACHLFGVDLASRTVFAERAIDPLEDVEDWYKVYVSFDVSPDRSNLLVTQWDYSREETLSVKDVVVESSRFTDASTHDTSVVIDDEGYGVLRPFFINDSIYARIVSTRTEDANLLSMVVYGSDRSVQTLTFPNVMAEEEVLPVSIVVRNDGKGNVLAAIGFDDDDRHTKGVGLVRIDGKSGVPRLLSQWEYPHKFVYELHDRELNLEQAIPTDIIVDATGDIAIVMEEHRTYRQLLRRHLGELKSYDVPMYPTIRPSMMLDEVILQSGAVFVASYSESRNVWQHFGIADDKGRLPEFWMPGKQWHAFPDRVWFEGRDRYASSMRPLGGSQRLLFTNNFRLGIVDIDLSRDTLSGLVELFTTERDTYVIPQQALWLNDHTVIFPASQMKDGYSLSIYKIGFREGEPAR